MPAAHPGPVGGPSAQPSGTERPRVLVVDDDWATRRAITAMLTEELGADVEEAEDARYSLMDSTPDVALVDAKMPWPDGLELVRRMKADPATAAVPVVGISASPVGARMLDAGCVAFVAKPFVIEELVEAVRLALWGAA